MNLTIKILSVLALIAVIIAAGVITIKTLTDENVKEGKPQKPEIVKVEKGERSEVKFAEPIEVKADDPIQPKYVPVNQPVYLMNLREEGKTYESRVLGKVQGQASKKDWGIRGTAYFYYTYGVESIGKIIKNDGVTIIEERSFVYAT